MVTGKIDIVMYRDNVTLQRASFCWLTANYFPISRTARQSCFVKGYFMAAWNLKFRVYFIKYPRTRHARARMPFVYDDIYSARKGRRVLVSLINSCRPLIPPTRERDDRTKWIRKSARTLPPFRLERNWRYKVARRW